MGISRQSKWQISKKAEGRCIGCGGEMTDGGTADHCFICAEKRRAYKRKAGRIFRANEKAKKVAQWRKEYHVPWGGEENDTCKRCWLSLKNKIHI